MGDERDVPRVDDDQVVHSCYGLVDFFQDDLRYEKFAECKQTPIRITFCMH
ncbi:MAG: hypothetical protein ACLFVP_08505 [Candidatus Bathyarchaeia archaeon]